MAFTAVNLESLSAVGTFRLVADDDLDIDSASIVHVCIGHVNNAFEGTLNALKGEHPRNWSSTTNVFTSGTVLVQDVDMLLPVLSGEWKCALLTTQYGGKAVPCGCMYWHSEAVGPEDLDAARLVCQMESAGAPISPGFFENVDTLKMAIKFIGRYAWDMYRSLQGTVPDWQEALASHRDLPRTDKLFLGEEDEDCVYGLFKGPTCFFVQPRTFISEVLPDISERAEQVKEKTLPVNKSNCQELPAGLSIISDSAGAVCVLPGQEYMFGRAFFTDELRTAARGFLFFTYSVPEESFGQVSIGGALVGPAPEVNCNTKNC